MKLSPPPDIAYDDDLKNWLHRMSILTNREGNCITFDTNTPRITLENAARESEDTGGNHPALLVVMGPVQSYGYRCRSGYAGTLQAYVFNFNWTGTEYEAIIDNTKLGNITLTSDYRLKHSVQDLDVNALDRISRFRPITYRWRNVDIFKDDGKTREGLIAHEVGAIIPSAAVGSKDGNDGKKDQYQYIDIMQLFPTLIKGIQELSTIVADQDGVIADLKKRIEALENKAR